MPNFFISFRRKRKAEEDLGGAAHRRRLVVVEEKKGNGKEEDGKESHDEGKKGEERDGKIPLAVETGAGAQDTAHDAKEAREDAKEVLVPETPPSKSNGDEGDEGGEGKQRGREQETKKRTEKPVVEKRTEVQKKPAGMKFNSSMQRPERSTQHNNDMRDSPGHHHLFNLPLQIRARIFIAVLQHTTRTDDDTGEQASSVLVSTQIGDPAAMIPLLKVCHQIREEAQPIFHLINNFILDIHDFDGLALLPWWKKMEEIQKLPVEKDVVTAAGDHTLGGDNVHLNLSYEPHWLNLMNWLQLYYDGRMIRFVGDDVPFSTPGLGHEYVGISAAFLAVHHLRQEDVPWPAVERMLYGAFRTVLARDNGYWDPDVSVRESNMEGEEEENGEEKDASSDTFDGDNSEPDFEYANDDHRSDTAQPPDHPDHSKPHPQAPDRLPSASIPHIPQATRLHMVNNAPNDDRFDRSNFRFDDDAGAWVEGSFRRALPHHARGRSNHFGRGRQVDMSLLREAMRKQKEDDYDESVERNGVGRGLSREEMEDDARREQLEEDDHQVLTRTTQCFIDPSLPPNMIRNAEVCGRMGDSVLNLGDVITDEEYRAFEDRYSREIFGNARSERSPLFSGDQRPATSSADEAERLMLKRAGKQRARSDVEAADQEHDVDIIRKVDTEMYDRSPPAKPSRRQNLNEQKNTRSERPDDNSGDLTAAQEGKRQSKLSGPAVIDLTTPPSKGFRDTFHPPQPTAPSQRHKFNRQAKATFGKGDVKDDDSTSKTEAGFQSDGPELVNGESAKEARLRHLRALVSQGRTAAMRDLVATGRERDHSYVQEPSGRWTRLSSDSAVHGVQETHEQGREIDTPTSDLPSPPIADLAIADINDVSDTEAFSDGDWVPLHSPSVTLPAEGRNRPVRESSEAPSSSPAPFPRYFVAPQPDSRASMVRRGS